MTTHPPCCSTTPSHLARRQAKRRDGPCTNALLAGARSTLKAGREQGRVSCSNSSTRRKRAKSSRGSEGGPYTLTFGFCWLEAIGLRLVDFSRIPSGLVGEGGEGEGGREVC